MEGSKCYGDNSGGDSQNSCDIYGRLYDWNMAIDVCPSSWHLPNLAEWKEMMNYIGDGNANGEKLKAKEGWSNSNGTDEYGFSALPGGLGIYYGNNYDFYDAGKGGYWWTADEYDNGNSRNWYMWDTDTDGDYNGKLNLYSVRCVRNH